jgi:hypothetical protein
MIDLIMKPEFKRSSLFVLTPPGEGTPVSLRHRKHPSPKLQISALVSLSLLCAAGARADAIYDITIINATFSATCIGGSGTCTEVVNGSILYDSTANTASNVSFQITGSLNASLDGFYNGSGTPPYCALIGCKGPDFAYDLGALPGHDPIEFSPTVGLNASTPQPLELGPNGSTLYVPALCGGDQSLCNMTGSFPGGANTDYQLTSGTYTSVATTPEPSSVTFLAIGIATLGFLSLRKRLASRPSGSAPHSTEQT